MNFGSWGKKWNDASLRRIVAPPENPWTRTWPLLGMLALGLVAGTGLGGYIVSQRSQMKRLARYAHRMGDEFAALGKPEAEPAAAVTSPRSNHRRKAMSEV
jgi:hypothetical protein